MAQVSMNEMTTFRWSFEEDVQHFQAAGFDGIGIWREKLNDFGEEKGMHLLEEMGLKVSSLLWAGGFTGSDGRSHADALDDARSAIHLASELRAGCLLIHSGARGGHTHNHSRRLFHGALTKLLPLAEELGVTLVVEPMHAACAAEWTFLTDLSEMLETVRSFSSERLKLVFDTYHLGHDVKIHDLLPRLAPHLGLVQLGDARHTPRSEQSRCRLGEGALPLRPLVESLLDLGYDGYFEVELMGEEIEAGDYDELLAQSRLACDELLGLSRTR